MTRREGREISEKRSRLGEKEKQPVLARLAARWKRSSLVILVALRKRKLSGLSVSEKGPKKNLYTKERDYLEGTHEEAEIEQKALRCGKNLAFSEDTC